MTPLPNWTDALELVFREQFVNPEPVKEPAPSPAQLRECTPTHWAYSEPHGEL